MKKRRRIEEKRKKGKEKMKRGGDKGERLPLIFDSLFADRGPGCPGLSLFVFSSRQVFTGCGRSGNFSRLLHVVGVLRCSKPPLVFLGMHFVLGFQVQGGCRSSLPSFGVGCSGWASWNKIQIWWCAANCEDYTQVVDTVNHGELPWKCLRSEHWKKIKINK